MKTVSAQEYYAAVRVPFAQVRRMSAGRCYDEFVTLCGKEIGSKHQILTRGKVSSETYRLNQESKSTTLRPTVPSNTDPRIRENALKAQPHGSQNTLRRVIWRQPYWSRGLEGSLLAKRPHVTD